MSKWFISGGTGSLGQALVDFLLNFAEVEKIVIYSRDEYKQYEMIRKYRDERLRFFIGDIKDKERLLKAFDGIDYIIHTAALKHVDTCEKNPIEAMQVNVMGTKNIMEAAIDKKVKKALLVSSDKACMPINIYGATKLCAEYLFIDGNVYSGEGGTEFAVIRFGNFIGSRGSVIPLWQSQKEYLPITDENMKRYWIKLDKAAEYCVKAIMESSGREIIIPKMDEFKIKDIARMFSSLPFKIIGKKESEKIEEKLYHEYNKVMDRGWCYVIK